jgi:L-alanine-DL-glutamate epimerase-like enolase superfamily enzyme
MSIARIAGVAFRALDVPMKKPFGISGGAQTFAANVLFEILLEDDVRGFGEGAPFPAFNGETQAIALAACAEVAPDLIGCPLDDTPAIGERLRGRSPSAICAIETALVDARARRQGISLVQYFGGAETKLVTDITITTGTVADAEREAREHAAFSTLKIKVGKDASEDIARVRAVRTARPDAKILVDANGGFAFDDALRFAAGIREANVALFEQPIAAGDWAAMAEVRRATKLAIALDESITEAADVEDAVKHGAADAINAKIMKSGVFEVLAIAAAAKKHGLARMIGGMVETRLAMGTSACIAAGLGGFAIVDLDTPLFLAEDPFTGGYAQDGERIDVSSVSLGHGLEPLHSSDS